MKCISNRVVNEMNSVNRVVYDMTSPASRLERWSGNKIISPLPICELRDI